MALLPHMRLALMSMADGVVIADTRSQEMWMNAAARAMLAIPADLEPTTTYLKEIVGFYPFDLVSSATGPLAEEVRVGDRILHSVVTPMADDAGHVGAVVVLRDLGETRDLAQRRSSFAELMSHELRTPLTSVSGALDIVLSGYAGGIAEKQRRYLDMARQAATRMNLIVDQLLDLARAQTGAIAIAAAPVELDHIARSVVEAYRPSAAAKGLRLQLQATAEAIGIIGDPDRLSQVLGNLLTNAIKFSPPAASIEVDVFGPPHFPDSVGVSVHNEGVAVPDDERERIFEPFSATGRRVGGTGLGLSICRSIVEAHGGRIWVESGATGTRFVFTLPVRAAADEFSDEPTPLPVPVPERRAGEGARVLLVDDDRRRALLLKGYLMAGGDEVIVAEDVDSALAIARRGAVELVVVSTATPEALALLAILEHDSDTRSLAVVAVADPEVPHDLLTTADEVVPHPVIPSALRDVCHRLHEARGKNAQRVMLVDDDSGVRSICRELLEHAGYLVREVSRGDAAVTEARRFRPDLVLLDAMMPGLDGFQIAEALRADGAIGLAPLIFLSAKGDTADKVRAFRCGAEDYLVKPFDAAELVARVGKALARQARELDASPTTQLPGADAIAKELDRRIAARSSAVVCYLDLDNLKALNDYYGFAKADAVIRQTGDLIRDVLARHGSPGEDFIGHIAGDDFVLLVGADRCDAVCRAIMERFDRIIPLYYDRDDRSRGYIEAKDRYGDLRRFPIMSVSIAAVSLARARTAADIATLAAVGKKAAKAIAGSAYVRDDEFVGKQTPTLLSSAPAPSA